MPDIDLEPGEYTERKPRGWRWKLPAGHADNALVPFVMFVVAIGFAIHFIANLPPGHSLAMVGFIAVMSFGAGAMFILWTRR